MGRVLDFLDDAALELGPMDAPDSGAHWTLATDDDGIAWLVLDRQDASANSLSRAVIEELGSTLEKVEAAKPKALVIRSAKRGGFIAGADISEFRGVSDPDAAREQLQMGHEILDRLAALECPTIAVVHGYALGGGFELALACDYRIATPGASFGFPEVNLGLHPGLGGTFRLPALIDPVEAMTMMLTGKTAHTDRAKKLGIVDLVVRERHLRAAIVDIVDGGIDRHEHGLKEQAFTLRPARAYAARQMRAKVAKKAPKEHYPAPHALIDIWEEHCDDPAEMQKREIESFAQLLTTDTAQNLIRVYFLRETLKGLGDGTHGITHVHVIGAGSMGGEIAGWCAVQGFRVTLGDVKNAPIAKAIKAAADLCDDRHLSGIEKRDALDRLIPDPKGIGIGAADLVIEAVPEDAELKQKIYASVEPKMKKGAILASNTSSLELADLTEGLERPGNFAGLHFFNPVSQLELVEVVHHKATDAQVQDRLRAFAGAISRLPAPVRSYPGFLVNRALMPYLMEALVLIDEGVDKAVIDRAAEDFGMPMGPVEVADQVGLDVCLHVATSLRDNIDKPMPEVPAWFREMVEKGDLGRKTGKGFYDWTDGKAQKPDPAENAREPSDLRNRLILPMLDACVECLRNDVVDNADIVDGAMIFATGFAPFRGGPIHYARQRGIEDVTQTLEKLAEEHGDRFQPDAGWSSIKGSS